MKKLIRTVGAFLQGLLIIVVVGALIAFGGVLGEIAWNAQRHGKTVVEGDPLSSLAKQGEFLGGHYGTLLSAVTLALLVYTSFIQARSSRKASIREMFSSGIDAVARYDIEHPGCPQALRILDYYSRLALDYDKKDYYLFLNTVMTGELREELRKPECPYRFAQAARDKITRINALSELRHDLGWWAGTWRFLRGRYRHS